MHRIHCSEIWGGIRGTDLDVCTSGVTATLYSIASEGGKGGDIYYFSVCGNDMITRIAVADVVGHGMIVSDLSQWIYDAMAARMDGLDGNLILTELNEKVCRRGLRVMTTAALFAYYKWESQLFFSYAGHPPQMLRRGDQGTWQPVRLAVEQDSANLPLGVLEGTRYSQEQIAAATGDRLFMYTDGVIEAPNPKGEKFGQSRLLSALEQAGNSGLFELKETVLAALRDHTGGLLSHDDVTLMAIEIS